VGESPGPKALIDVRWFMDPQRNNYLTLEDTGRLILQLCDEMTRRDAVAVMRHQFVLRFVANRDRRAYPVSAAQRKAILARDISCRRCNSIERLEVDHILAVSFGGTNDMSNLQILCRKCNREKGPQSYANRSMVALDQIHSGGKI
jgi:5-methylcytosine-specific restriction endonuclease McrA